MSKPSVGTMSVVPTLQPLFYPLNEARPALTSIQRNHSPKTIVAVLPVLILREPATAASPIDSKINNQIVKRSNDPAKAFKKEDAPSGKSKERLVAVILPGCMGLI